MPNDQKNDQQNGQPNDQLNDQPPFPRPSIFSDQFIKAIGEDLAGQIVDLLCKGLTESPPPVQPTSLCLEIIVFELDRDILKELIRCVFRQINPVIVTQEIIQLLQRADEILNGPKGEDSEPADSETPQCELTDEKSKQQQSPPPKNIDTCKFDILKSVNKKFRKLRTDILGSGKIRDAIFEKVLLTPEKLFSDKLDDIDYVINYVIARDFRNTLIQQYDKFALKLCNKITCVNSDIEFLSDQIKQITINFPAVEKGIIEIADAAGSVAQAFFSEEDDFDEIFDAVDEAAKVIEDLSEAYEDKLKQLEELYDLAPVGCPLPIEARELLPSIPEVPAPPPIFPIVTLPSSVPMPFTGPITL